MSMVISVFSAENSLVYYIRSAFDNVHLIRT